MSQDPQRSRPWSIPPMMECFHTRTSSLLLTSLSVTVMHGLAAGGHIHVLLSVVPQGGGSATSTNAYCGAANGHVVWLLWLRPVCQETKMVRYVKRPPFLFCHPVKWPLSGDLDLQPTPWSCMHCQSLPVLSLHWHAPLTFLEPLLPQDSPTAHPACSTPIPGASASSNVHPMRLACSLIPGASALLCLITVHPLCISHTQPSLQPLLPPLLVASSRLLLVLLCSPPLPKPIPSTIGQASNFHLVESL